MSKLQINLNGEVVELNSSSLTALLNNSAPKDRPFAIEINGIIVPSSDFKSFKLTNNDTVEIITAVGGG
tara:strand:- start:5264 stop:5470 length:207 start_codon:yes stop_codon:yes gene_type:complete